MIVLIIGMLRPIGLDYQAFLQASKIAHKWPYRLLVAKFETSQPTI